MNAGVEARVLRVLSFRVDGPDGAWSDEVVSSATLFFERRTRFDGATYAFGDDARGAWLRAGVDPARTATGVWLREERTRRALFAMRFLAPATSDAAELVTARDANGEYAFRPSGGQTLTFDVGDDDMPESFDSFDDFGRLVVCDTCAIFDVQHHRLAMYPEDSYLALNAWGLLVEARDGHAVVDRVVRGSPAEAANVHEGDRVFRVDDETVTDVQSARTLLARAARRPRRVTLLRNDVDWHAHIEPQMDR